MQPVFWTSEIEATAGAYGYSVLQVPLLGGKPERKTLLFVRNTQGWPVHAVLVPAETVVC